MTNLKDAVVRTRVRSVQFGLYTDRDVRARSVVEITSPLSYDALNAPLPGGPYDPRLGPTGGDGGSRHEICVTCGLTGRDCPGHSGHVELCVPVYHPLLFPTLVKLLRARCAHCHDLRVAGSECRFVAARLALLEAGRFAESAGLRAEVSRIRRAVREGKNKNNSGEETEMLNDVMKKCESLPKAKLTSHERAEHQSLCAEFLADLLHQKRCRNCGAFSPKIRHDAFNKIFQSPLSKKDRLINAGEGIVLRPVTDTNVDEEENQYDSEDDDDRGGIVPDDDDDDNVDDKDRYVPPLEAEARVLRTWRLRSFLCERLFGTNLDAYFMRVVPVPPSRFRPPTVLGTLVSEHGQTSNLTDIIDANERIRNRMAANEANGGDGDDDREGTVREWIRLQTLVNRLFDSDKADTDPRNVPLGIRQLLEKKEGIFRKHIMGKRVDHACRSVISPDPYVGTNEIGIPVRFAEKLSYPEYVTERNVAEMRRLVERGPDQHPGAVWVEPGGGHGDGRRIDLTRMDAERRRAVAARLLNDDGGGLTRVGRQLRTGDRMLVNRQPTLHKPGIMSHTVRILHSPTQQTIRMHYANCNTYNADFDGDEMNCHFPQNDLARAEAACIMDTDLQYVVPTDGTPLRGLIQDHVDAGVKLCSLDTFLEREQYQQLLFAMFDSLEGLEIVTGKIMQLPPAVVKPRELWTGKQVISTLLLHLAVAGADDAERLPLSSEFKSKTPPGAFGASYQEHLVLVRDGELLRGVLDKKAFGASEFGLVHAVHEAYGPAAAGSCLNALGRLFTAWLQYYAGHSCRMEDLVLTEEAERKRKELVKASYNRGARAAKAWADADGGKAEIKEVTNSEPLKPYESAAAAKKIGSLLSGKEGPANAAAYDSFMQSRTNPLASEVIKACLPNGLAVPFPANTFSLMVTTGAKGSTVNQSQVSCSLGQQALEGRRVPRLPSGRTLPSFSPYDPNPRADGFITDRFLTGVRPQEYYFHCMAGREGLVDTAVKTSRSGYLQRCLMKHLEELKVSYDMTVRDAEGGVVQFLYGEDGLDPTRAAWLDCAPSRLEYAARNHETLRRRYKAPPNPTLDAAAADAEIFDAVRNGRQGRDPSLFQKGRRVWARKLRYGEEWERGRLCEGWYEAVVDNVRRSNDDDPTTLEVDLVYADDGKRFKRVPVSVDSKGADLVMVKPFVPDPVLARGRLGTDGRCVSEKMARAASTVLDTDPRVSAALGDDTSKADLFRVLAARYASAVCHPGEAVGCVAAQSVGEPSTQMTLNTFHLAGSGANVTLGIPRLREIIMTASRDLKTPTMSVPLDDSVTERNAVRLARAFQRVTLEELVAARRGVEVEERLRRSVDGSWERAYHVTIRLQPAERVREAFGLELADVAKIVDRRFVPDLGKAMEKEYKKADADGKSSDFRVEIDADGGADATTDDDEFVGFDSEAKKAKKRQKAAEEYEDETTGVEDGVMGSRFGHRKEMSTYEEMDDEEKALMKSFGKDDAAETTTSDNDDDDDDQEPVRNANLAASRNTFDTVKIDEASNAIVLNPFKVDPAARPLLMVDLAERIASATVVRSHKGIDEAFINEEPDRGRCLQTAGINFEEIWKLNKVDHTRLLSNDIWAVRCAYGVEAARQNIVDQIRGVFAVYGISVDPRHLSLIADYMTYDGGYKAMNRTGMKSSSSGFLKMSFETTTNFLVDAAMNNHEDMLMSPSANIVVGQPVKHGTGSFECMMRS